MAKGDAGKAQNQIDYQQQRYEGQQGPVVGQMAYNYGYGSQTGMQDYQDIMNRYRSLYGQAGSNPYQAYTAGGVGPGESYGGYREFSQTGGYSPEDIANMRSRGVSPVRAAYANAEREVNRQRSLQGGYSPNMTASLAKMAREQSQGMSDALQNTELGVQNAIRQGRLAGLGGMSQTELANNDINARVGMFNASQQSRANELNQMLPYEALRGMTSLYGTSPGMASIFGNQLLSSIGQGGQFGQGIIGSQIGKGQMPSDWDTWMGRIGDIGGLATGILGGLSRPE